MATKSEEKVFPRFLEDEMRESFIDYSMSVIVQRALPDVRDGLKPVHRRILYAMNELGLAPNRPFKKSATVVGEVLGKYHPHGDMAVYDAMTRMAQDFSMRYQLVEGQGNFGSIDGDGPAAMRYTEARLQLIAGLLLDDIDKDTVDFEENFDGTLIEPAVLPAAIPNFLINGATGIAVGMATSVPPHNLGEVIDAIQFMIKNWSRLDNIGTEDLMQFIKGPDFPTGGIIIQKEKEDNLVSAYSTGKGKITLQARVHLEEMGRGKNRIIVSELPYMTNKSSLIERIADLARENKVEGIADLRDESDRQGMRIVIELYKSSNPEDVLSALTRWGMRFVQTPPPEDDYVGVITTMSSLKALFNPKGAQGVEVTCEVHTGPELFHARIRDRTIAVKIPAGIQDGALLRLAGQGDLVFLEQLLARPVGVEQAGERGPEPDQMRAALQRVDVVSELDIGQRGVDSRGTHHQPV